jgi:hypothetical protein
MSLIPAVGASGSRDGILSVIVIQLFFYIITCCPAQNPDVVGEYYPIVCQIPFGEAAVDVVHCAWAVPGDPLK